MRRRLRVLFLAVFLAGLGTVAVGPLLGNSESSPVAADHGRPVRSRQRVCVILGLTLQVGGALGYFFVARRTRRRSGRTVSKQL